MSVHRCGGPNCPFEGIEEQYVSLYKSGLLSELDLMILISKRDENIRIAEQEKKIEHEKEFTLHKARRKLQQQINKDVYSVPIEIFIDPKKFDEMALELYEK